VIISCVEGTQWRTGVVCVVVVVGRQWTISYYIAVLPYGASSFNLLGFSGCFQGGWWIYCSVGGIGLVSTIQEFGT
jgi:hypothetical protein